MNISNEMIEDIAESMRELAEHNKISAEERMIAEKEFFERQEKQAQQWKYFCSYAIYDPNGVLKVIDSGIFFMDNEIKSQHDMFLLDYTVSSFVKPEGNSFIKLISWHCLGEPIGTV